VTSRTPAAQFDSSLRKLASNRGLFEGPPNEPPHAVQNQLADVVRMLGELAREMTETLEGTGGVRSPEEQKVVLDVGPAGELINMQGGMVTKILSASALDLLADERRQKLGTNAASLANTYVEWRKLYARRKRAPFRFMQRRIDAQLKKLATATREQLDDVLSLLVLFGMKPDDQFVRLRALVNAAERVDPSCDAH
jgi:hypothetical protein